MTCYNQFGQPIGAPINEWQPRPLPQRVVLEGQYCRLIPLEPTHASDLQAAFATHSDERSFTWLPQEPIQRLDQWQSWIESVVQSCERLFFSVYDKARQQVTGVFSLMRVDPANGVIEVGFVHFSGLLSRTRLTTEAHWLLMRYVFATLGYRRYEWKCDSFNAPSRQAAVRLGFQPEGVFRQAVVYKGRSRDTCWFSIIDSEWPLCDQAFRQWLSPGNFDETGAQRQRLQSIRAALAEPDSRC